MTLGEDRGIHDRNINGRLVNMGLLTVRCKSCGREIREEVPIGYTIGPILRKHHFIAIIGGYICQDCAGPSLQDCADMLRADS